MKVRTRVIPILRKLEDGEYPTSIARLLKWSKQNVFYYIKKLEKAGLICKKTRSSIAVYELTKKGKELLEGCEGVVFSSGVYRLHHCCVKYKIYREGFYPEGGFRKVELVNWTALLGLECGINVRKTPRHWIVQCETIYGNDPGEVVNLALNLTNRVAKSLMQKYSVTLGEGKIQKGYELGIDDPVADFLSRYFEVSTPIRKLDHSLLKGEIDHLSKDAAIEYLLMPERIATVEKEIIGISSKLDEIKSNMQNLLAVSEQLDDLISVTNQLVNVFKNTISDGMNDLASIN